MADATQAVTDEYGKFAGFFIIKGCVKGNHKKMKELLKTKMRKFNKENECRYKLYGHLFVKYIWS